MPTLIDGAALADARAFLRLDATDDDEEALLTRLLGAGAELCARFTGLALRAADREAVLATGGGWQRLRIPDTRAPSVLRRRQEPRISGATLAALGSGLRRSTRKCLLPTV